jgi:hypothetical protein
MPEYENIVVDDIVVDMLGCSTPESTPEPEPYSLIIQHKTMCLIVILAIEEMEIMLSDLCRRDVKDKTMDQYRLPG